MKRASFVTLLLVLSTVAPCSAQAKRVSAESKSARQEMILAPLGSASAPAVPAHPSPYNLSGVQYPRIEEDSRVTFQFKAPTAQKVQVALVTSGSNSLNPLPYDMVKGDDGVMDIYDQRTAKPRVSQLLDDRRRRDGAGSRHQCIHRLRPHVQRL